MTTKTDDISVEAENLPGSQVQLKIDVPQSTVDAAFERVVSRLAQRVKIEGFRPGKAPRALVEARVGPDALREEVIDSLIPQVVSEALGQKSIDAIDRPRVDVVELERGKPAKLTAKVSVMPEIKLPDLGSIRLERKQTEVTNEMVEERLLELLDQLAEVEPVEREVRLGDVIVADMDVFVDGNEMPGEARRAMEADVREGVLIPELLAALPGKKVGEVAEADIKLAGDHVDPELRGKDAHLRMTVQGVKEKRVPDLTDEVAARVSNGEHSSVLALRGAVRADLEEQAKRMDELSYEQQVLKDVVDRTEVEVPEALVDHEVAHQLESMQNRLQSQGLRLDRYFEYLGQSPEQWLAQAKPDAESRLKVDMVLEEIGRQEGIEPSDEDVLAHMQEEASRDKELSERFTELVSSRAARDYFKHRLTRLRILERLVQRASGEYKPQAAEPEGESSPTKLAEEEQSGGADAGR